MLYGCWHLLQPKSQPTKQPASQPQRCDHAADHHDCAGKAWLSFRQQHCSPHSNLPFSIAAAATCTVDCHKGPVATMHEQHRCGGRQGVAGGIRQLQGVAHGDESGSPPSQFADLQCQLHWMSVSQRFLSLSVVPLFTGAIPWPRTPSTLLLSPTLNRPQPQLQIRHPDHNEITNEITTAHCSLPMLPRPSDDAGPSPWWWLWPS